MRLWVVLALCCIAPGAGAEGGHWLTTWGCGVQLTEARNLPPALLANSTLRQFARVTVGGKRLRVRFSNAFGKDSVTINAAHIALSAGSGRVGNGEINTATDKPLMFDGKPVVAIPPGAAVLSDPIDFDLPAFADVAISIFFGDISGAVITGHPGSRTTSFILSGNNVVAPTMPGAATTAHWYIMCGIDVWANDGGEGVVVLGDSITDGRGSTTDGNDRWPDDLARRLAANPPTAGVAVVNMGIGGNGIFGGLGPSAVARFDRDVLGQSGARWLIVFEGVNDIGGSRKSGSSALSTNLINAYHQFVAKAHARNILAYGATITPFAGSSYFSRGHEAVRQTVNTWIRTNNLYDGVIDFDAAVRDPAKLESLRAAYDSGDGLHLNPVGYHAMANAINLTLFGR